MLVHVGNNILLYGFLESLSAKMEEDNLINAFTLMYNRFGAVR